MSTSSSQFHTLGSAIGRDFFEKTVLGEKHSRKTVIMTKLGMLVGVVATVLLGFKLPGSIIAIATAIFFGLCASTFLPAYAGGLFWKGMTKVGAAASMVVGSLGTMLWLLFVHQKESEALGLCKFIFGKPTLASFPWTVVDPVVVILPVSLLTALIVSLCTKKFPGSHLHECFKNM
jgi:SSS family solute:Na+ symporter